MDGSDEGDVTIKQFRLARIKLKFREKNGKLSDNQLSALKAMKGKPFKTLSESQRLQIVSMAKDKG